jgi:hypothetical protein
MGCHGGVLDHFSWTNARVSRIELNLWRSLSSIILSPEHPQNDEWSELLGKTEILPKRLIQEGRWTVNHVVMEFLPFCILFRDHISPFNETCLFVVSLLLWNHEMLLSKGILTKYVWSNSNMQSLIMNIKSVLIAEMTWCLKMTWGDQTILNSYLLKLNHTSYS